MHSRKNTILLFSSVLNILNSVSGMATVRAPT